MAYILGFIYTDGSLIEYRNGYHGLDITNKDITLLKSIKKKLGAGHKIGKKERGYRLQIRNRSIYRDLLMLGLIPRKSKNIRSAEVPQKYFSHFIRGVFNGDGSVMV